jgi:xylulokinase
MTDLVVGIDSSTQSCKVLVCDAKTLEVVREAKTAHPDGTEVDPELWWTALKAAIQQAGGLGGVKALSVGGQQHGLVALNKDGRVVRKALLWNDTRSASQADQIIEKFGKQYLTEHTGSVPVASFTATKLLWVSQNEPEIAKTIAAVCLPHDYLTWRLAGYGPEGESEFGPQLDQLVTDRSDASGTGYFNGPSNQYVTAIIDFVIDHEIVLPKVLQAAQVAGKIATSIGAELGATGEVILGGGMGDNAGAAMGLNLQSGDIAISIGTSGTIFGVVPGPSADESAAIAGFASADGHYLPLICTLNAARVLDWAAKLLNVDFDELGRLALAAKPGAEGVKLTPYFEGERTPNLPDATATIEGLRIGTGTRENIARAAIEGMLRGLGVGKEILEGNGFDINKIFLIGGAAANPAVRQIAREIFGEGVTVPKANEYVALGAARQAASLI